MFHTNGMNEETAVSQPTVQQIQNEVKNALEAVMGESSPEMLNELSGIFLDDAVPLLNQLQEGYAAQDFQLITAAAHTLKGSSATMGLDWFAKVCLAVETSSKQRETALMKGQIAALISEYTLVEKVLKGFLL